ncbi:hypothetical protein [Romboutsia lituseburensis]
MEITKFSRKLLPKSINDEYVEKQGDKPNVIGFLDEKLIEDIKAYK